METDSKRLEAFLAEQDGKARAALADLPGRDELRKAIRTANRGVTQVSIVAIVGTKPDVFTWRRAPDDDQAQLWVRAGWAGRDRLLVDPRKRDTKTVHHSIDYQSISPDGKHVAYGISASGSEDSTVEILEVATGKVLPERISRAQYASIVWRDNTSFFYWRRRSPGPKDTKADWFKHSASYLHVLGDDPEKAQAVTSPTILGLGDEFFTSVGVWDGSPWAITFGSPGTSAALDAFVAPIASIKPGEAIPWRRIVSPADGIYDLVAHGDTIYAHSYKDAARYRVLAIDAKRGTAADARIAMPESSMILEGFAPAKDALYLQYVDGGMLRVMRLPWTGGGPSPVKLPFEGSGYLRSDSRRRGIVVGLTGWTKMLREYIVAPGKPPRDSRLTDAWPVDYSKLASKEVEVKSADGTLVPMSIIHPKDLVLDGSAPGFLDGYQAYGGVDKPYFNPISLTFAERGVRARCHGRGSGTKGKQWHLDGMKLKKERGVDDLIACAEYLIANKYTSTAKLGVSGTSAGGILAGGAVTKRPDLFTAAVLRVPVLNLARLEATEGGPANVPEFGSMSVPEERAAIMASDPYLRLRARPYPAMLITTGHHDVRVPAWQPSKFVARAQTLTTSGKPILLRVESDAGHGLGSTRAQVEDEWADIFSFVLAQGR
jgi:prolyl oligopeptidase